MGGFGHKSKISTQLQLQLGIILKAGGWSLAFKAIG